jgi:hypothetical protein
MKMQLRAAVRVMNQPLGPVELEIAARLFERAEREINAQPRDLVDPAQLEVFALAPEALTLLSGPALSSSSSR